jgi:hypothetical protein
MPAVEVKRAERMGRRAVKATVSRTGPGSATEHP